MIKELAAAEEEKAKVVRKVIFFFVGGGTTLCSDRSYSLSSVSFSFHITPRKLSPMSDCASSPL